MINQPLGNRGDESAHKGLIRFILSRHENVHIDVLFCGEKQTRIDDFKVYNPRVQYINIKKTKGFGRFAIKHLKKRLFWTWHFHPTIRKLTALYKKSDIILNAPGGICMGGFQFWEHLFYLMIAKRLNKPIVYYGRSFGPFPTKTRDNRLFKEFSMELLNYFSFMSFRDKKSELLAKELHLSYEPTVDSAFLDTPYESIPYEIDKYLNRGDYMVLVPNSLVWHYAYKDKTDLSTVRSFFVKIIEIVSKKFPSTNLILLPQLCSDNNTDYTFFKEIEAQARYDKLHVLPDTLSSDLQQTVIRNAKFLIGARYHSVVFSLNQNTPFIALNYEHKIAGLLETLNKNNCMVNIENIWNDDYKMDNALREINSKLNELHEDHQACETAQKKAQMCFEKFEKKFGLSN